MHGVPAEIVEKMRQRKVMGVVTTEKRMNLEQFAKSAGVTLIECCPECGGPVCKEKRR